MDGCTKGPQLAEGENLNTRALGTGRTPPGGTSAPAGQAQGGPSPAFVKENIDVLRTMIKELDNRGQEKMSPSAEEVGGYSSDGSSRSRSRGRPWSSRKNRKSVSKKKGISKSHRSVRPEARSRSKSKSVKSKPQSVRASRRKSSSYSGYDTVSDSGSEDLSMPYRQPKPMPFTSRITRFRYHRRAKLPPNVRVYKGNKDPEDHLSIFSAAVEQEEWPMPVWCKMFRQTLSGLARNWFDRLDPKSVGGFEESSNKFLEEFSQLEKEESAHIKGVPPVLRISAFMHGHDHPELAKKLNDKIPKIVDEMWERVRAFIRGETAANTTEDFRSPRGEKSAGTCAPYARREGFTPLTKTPKEILAMDNVNFPPPPSMVGTPKKRNMNKFCDYHQDRGHNTNDCYNLKKQIEEAVASGRLAHLVKDIRQGGQKSKGPAKGKEKHWMDNAITFPSVPRYQLMNCLVVVEAMIEGFRVRRIHVDGGSSSEVIEVSYPMGVIDLEVTMRECGKTRTVIIEFAVVKSPSPYNALLYRMGMRSLGVVASTIHSMMKFPTSNGIATISTTRETLRECRRIKEAQDLSRHTRVADPTPMQTSSEVANPRVSLAPVETHSRRPGKEPMQLDDMEERQQLDKGRKPPKSITQEKIVVQKKRSLAPDRRKVVTDEVNEWLKAGIMTKKDEEKTAFHTEEGVFCHTKLPFGLKNVGATYQRLVDSAFKEQIGVNLEAYVDDMVIKSRTEQDIIKDIEQTFSTLRRINMKLNPKKCSFGMEEGKFLGYIVTLEGIRANPEKAKAVMDMPSPRTLKQMQSLSGKLAALNCFLSKSAERSLPFLDTLKKCTNKKDFRWTEAAEAAFLEMKKLVSKLLTHTIPKKGKTLMMYLAAANEAVSAVLHTERDGRQMENAYTLEDVPESSNARENLTPGLRAWRLYTDGASNNEGSGVGLILIASDDVEYSYALRLNFSNSNNDAEYEALMVGLRIAKEMDRITHLPRAENRKADALSKLAAVQFDHLSKEVLVEVLNERSLEANYTMEYGVLYRKFYLVPLMRYVGPLQANYVIRKVHMGLCGMHDGPRQVVAKAMNLGYFWPSMHRDVRELIRACDDCQAHASVPRLPKAVMISVASAWPFMKWGMDIVRPLPEGLRMVKYLIVATDYFTKWMEVKPLATITGKQVVNFTWDNIVCRFGMPATIITDNGTQFVNDPFKKWAENLKIQLISTSIYHPQGVTPRQGGNARRKQEWISSQHTVSL
ncbi:reverse transcriptase domain-containing protein [Tanacetum coccineum]|uniref:Reverse transcriptase domain-containing protein n=1 Tax=Tanacetum coccineum TaxID=301880 RepID=A0ABQ5A4U1_9ASTR